MALKAGPKGELYGALPQGLDGAEFARVTQGPLYRWQAPIVNDLTADSRPRVAYVQVPRKNGKSRLGAAVAIDEMCQRGGQVFLIADSERNLKSALFFELTTLVRTSPILSETVHLFKDHLECPSTGGGVYLRPNNLSASQSINPDLVVFDEVHMQKSDQIWNGMVLAGAASDRALVLGITTPGYDVTSMAHGLYQQVRAGTDPSLYGVIYEPTTADAPWDDREALWQANPVLLDRPELEQIFISEQTKIPEHDYRRFRLGQWTATASAWLPYGAWDACRHPTLSVGEKPAAGTRVWLGFDGSYSGDSTALVGVTEDGYVWVEGVWENPGRPGWRVPRDEVNDAVTIAMGRYKVVELLCDPPYWSREISEWTSRWPRQVLEFPTFSRTRMAPACTSFYSAVMEGRITHDGDPRMARHIANAVVKASPQGDYITKADKDSPAKIDLAIAGIIAYSRAGLVKRHRSPACAR